MYRLSLAVVSLMILAGCGQSNPASKYSDLKTDPLNRTNYSTTDQTLDGLVCRVNVPGGTHLNFNQGEAGSAPLTVSVAPGVTGCKLYLDEKTKPKDMKLVQGSGNNWAINWTPPVGTVTNGGTSTIAVTAYALPTSASPDSDTVNPVTLYVTVNKNQSIPKITSISGFRSTFSEGDSPFSFTVNYSAPGIVAPQVAAVGCNSDVGVNKEKNIIVDGHSYFTNVPGSNTWVFDPSQHPVKFNTQDFANVNQVEICVSFFVPGGTTNFDSARVDKTVYFTMKNQAPQIVFEGSTVGDSSPLVLKAGQTSINLTAAIADKVGITDVKVSGPFMSQKGVSPANCINGTNSDLTVQTCTIAIADVCKLKSGTQIIVTARNTQNGPKDANVMRRNINIDSSQSCDSAPAKVASTVTAITPPASASVDQEKATPVKARQIVRGITSSGVGAVPPQGVAPKLVPTLKSSDANKIAQFIPVAPKSTDAKKQTSEEKKAHKTKAHRMPTITKDKPATVPAVPASGGAN